MAGTPKIINVIFVPLNIFAQLISFARRARKTPKINENRAAKPIQKAPDLIDVIRRPFNFSFESPAIVFCAIFVSSNVTN